MRRFSSFPVYTSLSTAIDRLLGGGYRVGTTTEVFGKSNTGKTQLAMQAVMSVAQTGARTLFVDTEGAFRPERIEGMAAARGWNTRELLERVVYIRAVDSTLQREIIRRLDEREETASCRFVAVDTLTENFSLDFPGSQNLPRRQGELDAHLSEIARDAYLNERAYLLANRVVTSQEGVETHVGGRTVEQMVHRSVHLFREGERIRAKLLGGNREDELASLGATGFD